MKAIDHVKCCFTFWRPSVARRMTLYFVVFGLLVFLATTAAHMLAAKKHFIHSAVRIVEHQIDREQRDSPPDIIWKSVGRERPELTTLAQMLASVSSAFYAVADMEIYCRQADRRRWQRIILDDDRRLALVPSEPATVTSLERKFSRHPGGESFRFTLSEDVLAAYIDITRPQDRHAYYLVFDIDRAGFAYMISRKIVRLAVITATVLLLLRILGYFFARRLARPIEALSQGAAEVARGDLSVQVPVTTHDEIGELSRTFNHMIEGLREREQARLSEFELEKGRKIQRDFLPHQIPSLPDWEIAAFLDPAGQVSGDFYDVFPLGENRIGLVIADVCDKGMGSAFYMALFRSLIRIYAEQFSSYRPANVPAPSPGAMMLVPRVVQLTNDYIARNHGHDGMFATIFFGVLDPASGRLDYVNAGHEPLYVVGPAGIRIPLDPTGPAVGLMPGTIYRPDLVELAHGEVLMGYTDGLTEARSPEGEFFSRRRLQSLLSNSPYSAGDLLDSIKTSLFNFIGSAPREDDVTLLAVQRAAPQV
ncbi:MAG: SpoIIE family protein phosphatase [Desulfobacterales bacterium]|nr:SpoIIE family protein phosphatase [Desulfobacterales bacterium]